MKTFLYSYNFHGARWSFDVPAGSKEEAEHRLVAMSSAQYDGEIGTVIPAMESHAAFWFGVMFGAVLMAIGSLVFVQMLAY